MLIPLLYSVLYGQERLGHRSRLHPASHLGKDGDGARSASSPSGAIIHPRPGVIVYVRETRSDPGPSSGTNNDALDCGYHRYIALHSRHLKNAPLFSDTEILDTTNLDIPALYWSSSGCCFIVRIQWFCFALP